MNWKYIAGYLSCMTFIVAGAYLIFNGSSFFSEIVGFIGVSFGSYILGAINA